MPLTVVTISKEMGWDKTQSVSVAFSSLTHDVESQTIKAWYGTPLENGCVLLAQ